MSAYISEIDVVGRAPDHTGPDNIEFVEIAVSSGTDMSGYSLYVYAADGSVSEGPLSLGTVQSTVAGKDAYLVNGASGLGDITYTEAIALVDNLGNVVQFISFNGNTVTGTAGPANGSSSTNIGTHGFDQSLQSVDGGTSYTAQNTQTPGVAPCYAPGTLIDTPNGPRAVETLQPGDLVMTLDHGPQPIRWVHSGVQPLKVVGVDAKPVLIAAGALGPGLPAQDLIVSPQHRILVGGKRQLRGLFQSEAFAPAKSLTSLRGIRHMNGKTEITWIQFACDRHEVVTANGCLSESLLLGPIVVNGMSVGERRAAIEIFGLAPTPDEALNGPPARECLTVGAVRRQLAKNLEMHGQHVATEIRKWDVDAAIEQNEAELPREENAKSQIRMTRVA